MRVNPALAAPYGLIIDEVTSMDSPASLKNDQKKLEEIRTRVDVEKAKGGNRVWMRHADIVRLRTMAGEHVSKHIKPKARRKRIITVEDYMRRAEERLEARAAALVSTRLTNELEITPHRIPDLKLNSHQLNLYLYLTKWP